MRATQDPTSQETSAMTTHRTPAIPTDHPDLVALPGSVVTSAASRALAVLRVATGFVFLWAFLDKTFGLHYSTPNAKSWLNGGSPTKGFLGSVEVGPLQSLFHTIAGTWYADWLFMLGLLGIGVALMAGVAVRAGAVVGVILLAGMWLAEFPPAQHAKGGAPTGSTNPLTDYHVIYALGLVVLAATYAGTTWGLGRVWARLPFVSQHRWAL
jgi:thiosulfate dehydrogenase (quinone) large subunit